MRKYFLLLAALALAACSQSTGSHTVDIAADQIGAPIQSTMYGLFFEDINFAADGGIYAELVKNRSFEFPQNLMGWDVAGKVSVRNDGPFDRNPHYVRLESPGHPHKHTAIENEGFFGMGLKENAEYTFSVWARGAGQKLRVELIDNNWDENKQALVSQELDIASAGWEKYEITLTSPVTIPDAHLRVFLMSDGPVDLEHVSLFPVDTWEGRKGGLRKDLVQALYDIHPGVFRFPGGCIVEGTDLATRYNWKNSVGPVENRPLNENRWHYTFDYRFFPDYFQSYGLGFFEYFQLCEDIGAEPLPVISCGLACQFQNENANAHVPVAQLQPYIQDALDLIEFANGDASSTWGKVRAEMGHPEPFNLKFLAVGNEQWGPEYPEHLAPFVTAIREKYPDIKLVGTSGPDSEGEQFDYLWPEMKKLGADLVDEHFYRPEEWFLAQGLRYDSYDREGPKVFAGEYACHMHKRKFNQFEASLYEAAFMTGLERNADVVHMATYAPLFAHVDGWQWRPDLIWFDNLNSVRTCSYYVQQLYSLYKGTNVLPCTMNGAPLAGQEGQDGLFASAVYDEKANAYYVKIANTSDAKQSVDFKFTGTNLGAAKCISLHSDDMYADNTIDNPENVVPVESPASVKGNTLKATIPAKTFALYIIEKR